MSDDLYELFRRWGLSDLGANSLRHGVEIAITVALALLISRILTRSVRRWTETLAQKSTFAAAARAHTLGGVAASTIRIVVWTFAALFVVGEMGLNLGPLIAGASVIGVALGFGAQTLVKDFLAGFFILAEDQFGVGDVVALGGESASTVGVVEEVSLRITRLRDDDGTVWFVPNGEIRKVGNRSRGI